MSKLSFYFSVPTCDCSLRSSWGNRHFSPKEPAPKKYIYWPLLLKGMYNGRKALGRYHKLIPSSNHRLHLTILADSDLQTSVVEPSPHLQESKTFGRTRYQTDALFGNESRSEGLQCQKEGLKV
jgi:hypothetical protein